MESKLVDAFLNFVAVGSLVGWAGWWMIRRPSYFRAWLVLASLLSIGIFGLGLRVHENPASAALTSLLAPVLAAIVVYGEWLRQLPLNHALRQEEEDRRERARLRGRPFDFDGD